MCFKRPAIGRWRAFTLVEFLVVMAIGTIMMAAVASLTLYTARSFAMLANYVELDNQSRTALDTLTRDVRQVVFLDDFASNKLVLVDYDGQRLSYTYDVDKRTLTRSKANESKVLLTECDELVFNIWQRNTLSNSYDLVATTNPDLTKAIDVTWICSRKILGAKVNTESVQTARVVIRKQQGE